MYSKGDLKVTDPPCVTMDDDGDCNEYDKATMEMHKHAVRDSRDHEDLTPNARGCCLPHSCDEWVIGGIPEIEAMIADLQEAAKIIRKNQDGL